MSRESLVSSITNAGGGIKLSHFFEDSFRLLTGRITEVHIMAKDLTTEDLGKLANRALGTYPLTTQEIYTNQPTLGKEDFNFAKELGFILIPNFAFLGRTEDGAIKAWISPAFLPQDHPMAKKEGEDAVVLFTSLTAVPPYLLKNSEVVQPFEQLALARYVRLTVEDKPHVLASVCKAFGGREINIHELRQPETSGISQVATLAIILNPCPGVDFKEALKIIRALPSCKSINTVLPVIGLGRFGIT